MISDRGRAAAAVADNQGVGPVLVIGRGMVGTALAAQLAARGVEHQVCDRRHFDLSRPATLRELVEQSGARLVFHAAALTRVNYCEQHPAEARVANGESTSAVVQGAQTTGARLVYFSSDYVFDGTAGRPYTEADAPNPVNAYGASKLLGEKAVATFEQGHIVRISGVFGPREGNTERNFVRAIWEQLDSSNAEIPVVADQYTCLTWSTALAQMLLAVLAAQPPPVMHLACAGADSWHGWARRICTLVGASAERIVPTTSAALGDEVLRPRFSVLDSHLPALQQLRERNPAEAGLSDYVSSLAGHSGGQY